MYKPLKLYTLWKEAVFNKGGKGRIFDFKFTFFLIEWVEMGPPVRDASKVLECGLLCFVELEWGGNRPV
jgi:hypothetical protein